MANVALGAGKQVACVKIDAAPALVTIECERLGALNKVPAGGPDEEGFELHLRYEGVRPMLLEKSDDARPILVAEFDAQRIVVVPYCGTLALVGGKGRYRWSMSKPERWPGVYQPQWRALTRLVVPEVAFVVPDGHTRIGALNAGTAIKCDDGDPWALDGSPKAIGSGTRATVVGGDRARIFTLTQL
jgi:hypothetical protein